MSTAPKLLLAMVGLLALASTAAARTTVGVLPVSGPRSLAVGLDRSLGGDLRRSGIDALGPSELAGKLRQDPSAAAALDAARVEIGRADQATIFMQRRPAVGAARKALALLDTVSGRYLEPEVYAQAQMALGLSLLLMPADAEGARTAIRAALEAAPELQPNPDVASSRVAALVEKVREERRPASPPTLQTWINLATLTGAERLVWVDARPRSGTIEVKSLLFDRRTQTVHHAGSVRLRETELRGGAAGLLQRGLARLRGQPPSELDKPPATAVRPHRPWYRRWWIWTLAGAVVLGGTTTAVVLTTRDRKTNYDLRVGF